MISDIDNMRKMVELLGDQGFVDALTNVEKLVEDVDRTLDRVEQIEGDAEQAVREANDALQAVDTRLKRFDETIRLLEAKIEAGFTVGFFFFALHQWTAGEPLLAAGLFIMGLLGISSLVVTIATMPQVRRLRQAGKFMSGQLDSDDDSSQRDEQPTAVSQSDRQHGRSDTERQPGQKSSDSDGRERTTGTERRRRES